MLASFRAILRSEDIIVDALRRKGVEGGRKVVLDFSSPNIAKTFHAGNLRSTLVGNFLRKALKAAGCEVTSINYLGDWGIQFAMLATYWQSTVNRPNSEEWRGMGARQRIELLTKSYVEANAKMESNSNFKERVQQVFRDMERLHTTSPPSETMEEIGWCKEWRDLSRNYLEDFYSRFHGIRFDEWHAESEQLAEGARVVDELIRRGVVRQDSHESYWSVPVGQPGGGAVVRKSDGTSLYLTRDLGAIYSRHKRFNADEYLYVVEQSQHKHFEQLKALVRALGDEKLADGIRHISVGRITGLSTRSGKNDSVDFLIEKGEEEAREVLMQSRTTRLEPAEMTEMCNKLSRTILVFDIMSKRRARSYTFSFKDAFSTEGKTAVHLQEKYSRLCSVQLRNGDLMERVNSVEEDLGRYRLETSHATERLSKQIQQFDNALLDAYREGETYRMCSYLVGLAQQIGKSVPQLHVYGEVEKVALPRLMLLSAAKRVLGDGMRFVGLEPMDRT